MKHKLEYSMFCIHDTKFTDLTQMSQLYNLLYLPKGTPDFIAISIGFHFHKLHIQECVWTDILITKIILFQLQNKSSGEELAQPSDRVLAWVKVPRYLMPCNAA